MYSSKTWKLRICTLLVIISNLWRAVMKTFLREPGVSRERICGHYPSEKSADVLFLAMHQSLLITFDVGFSTSFIGYDSCESYPMKKMGIQSRWLITITSFRQSTRTTGYTSLWGLCWRKYCKIHQPCILLQMLINACHMTDMLRMPSSSNVLIFNIITDIIIQSKYWNWRVRGIRINLLY